MNQNEVLLSQLDISFIPFLPLPSSVSPHNALHTGVLFLGIYYFVPLLGGCCWREKQKKNKQQVNNRLGGVYSERILNESGGLH